MRKRNNNPALMIASIIFFVMAAALVACIVCLAIMGSNATNYANELIQADTISEIFGDYAKQVVANATTYLIVGFSIEAGVYVLMGIFGLRGMKTPALVFGFCVLALQVVGLFVPRFNPWEFIDIGINVLYMCGAMELQDEY